MNNTEIAELAAAYLKMHGTQGALAQARRLENKKRATKREKLLAAALRVAVLDAL